METLQKMRGRRIARSRGDREAASSLSAALRRRIPPACRTHLILLGLALLLTPSCGSDDGAEPSTEAGTETAAIPCEGTPPGPPADHCTADEVAVRYTSEAECQAGVWVHPADTEDCAASGERCDEWAGGCHCATDCEWHATDSYHRRCIGNVHVTRIPTIIECRCVEVREETDCTELGQVCHMYDGCQDPPESSSED